MVPFETNKGVEDDDQNINIGIEHVTSKIEDVTSYLRKLLETLCYIVFLANIKPGSHLHVSTLRSVLRLV